MPSMAIWSHLIPTSYLLLAPSLVACPNLIQHRCILPVPIPLAAWPPPIPPKCPLPVPCLGTWPHTLVLGINLDHPPLPLLLSMCVMVDVPALPWHFLERHRNATLSCDFYSILCRLERGSRSFAKSSSKFSWLDYFLSMVVCGMCFGTYIF